MKNITSLNEEAEQLIDEIEHINMEEKKRNEISDEYRHYDGEENVIKSSTQETFKNNRKMYDVHTWTY